MRKTFLCLFFSGTLGSAVMAQPDTAPIRVKSISANSNYAGGVDKNKITDFFQDQQFDEAIGYLSPVLQADSDNIPVLNYAGYAYYMSDNGAAAVACYQRMLSIDSNSITAMHYLVLLKQSEGADAVLDYALRLVLLQPRKAVWWRSAGELWRRMQRPDSALVYLEKAYELAPGDVKTVSALGEVLIDGKAFGKADSIVDLALQKDSLNTSLLKLRVRSAYVAKDYEQALVPGERLLRMNEPAVNTLEYLALSYYDLKLYPDCIRVCEAMLDMGLEIESVYYYESRAQSKMKAYDRSNELLRIALGKAIGKTAEWYYDDLGDNYESLRDFRKSLAHYDTAYYLFKDPTTLYTCGRICEIGLHNNQLARLYYRRYLVLAKPQTEEEKKAYRYVKERWGRKK